MVDWIINGESGLSVRAKLNTIPASLLAAGLTVGSSAIASGGTGRVLYQNGSVLGEMTTTGSGTVVALATSPNFITPILGTPTSGVLTNCTGTASGLTAGTVTTNANLTGVITSSGNATSIASQTGTGTKFVVDNSPVLVTPTLGVATATSINGNTFTTGTYTLTGTAGKTFTFSNSITMAGTDSTTMTFPPASASVGYLNVPQNSRSAAYTTVLADSGKHILHPVADNNPQNFTIDSNANVAYPVGTVITFVNQINVVTIKITTDTMVLAGGTSTGDRTLAAYGIATALKLSSQLWVISGTGLT